jgi:hypothetical protein
VIVVASVSCIYSLGAPEEFTEMCVRIACGDTISRNDFLARLVEIQYTRNDAAPERGQFRVRGDVVDVYEPQRHDFVRISFPQNVDSCRGGGIAGYNHDIASATYQISGYASGKTHDLLRRLVAVRTVRAVRDIHDRFIGTKTAESVQNAPSADSAVEKTDHCNRTGRVIRP